MSNRQLGGEFAYVLDRKGQTRYIGNSLEKPQLLLKRHFIRDTNFDKLSLDPGNDFENNNDDASYSSKCDMDYEREAL